MNTIELPKGVTYLNNRYRARIKRGGVWYTRPSRANAKDAVEDLRDLKALHPPVPRVKPGVRDLNRAHRAHREQLETVPRYTRMTGIYRGVSGYTVKLTRRRGEVYYGGHFKTLLPAVQCRDELERLHPVSE